MDTLTVGQQAKLQYVGFDEDGNPMTPVKVDFATSNADVQLDVDPNDPTICTVTALSPISEVDVSTVGTGPSGETVATSKIEDLGGNTSDGAFYPFAIIAAAVKTLTAAVLKRIA